MLYESLDPHLESAIASLCDGDWSNARELLSQRLEETARLGRRRLNLFLLSHAACRSGHQPMGEQLAELARATPLELGEPRYFGTSEDPVRRELEQSWWAFNNWNPEQAPASSQGPAPAGELDWAALLDGALEGRSGELERRCSGLLDGAHPQGAILWNLVALAYLESGDLRTYEEMRDQAPAPATAGGIPQQLADLLCQAGLASALAELEAGRWLTSDSLSASRAEQAESAGAAGSEAWEQEMEASFSLLSVGRSVEAARKLGPLSMRKLLPWQRAYTLNALALALFSCGEYGSAEDALREGRAEAAQAGEQDAAQSTQLAQRYTDWLRSAGAQPASGGAFCDPFASEPPACGQQDGGDHSGEEAYWSGFEETLEALRSGDLSGARRTLRRLLAAPSAAEPTRAFLTALLLAGAALLEGDHMDAQESIDDASRWLQKGGLDPGLLVEAQGRLAAAGALTLAAKMDLEILPTLDPWRDFAVDFPQQSFSGY
jgi:hypothetical protein